MPSYAVIQVPYMYPLTDEVRRNMRMRPTRIYNWGKLWYIETPLPQEDGATHEDARLPQEDTP